jgi:hypothetical protein
MFYRPLSINHKAPQGALWVFPTRPLNGPAHPSQVPVWGLFSKG